MADTSKQTILRQLPAVQDLLHDAFLEDAQRDLPRPLVVAAIQDEIAAARKRILDGNGHAKAAKAPDAKALVKEIRERVKARLAREAKVGPRRVINATGVIVHTNLGRAPLAAEAIEHVVEVARGYSTLEYDLERGERGSRQAAIEKTLVELLGCEAAIAVNNNAAAVMLALAALAAGKEVVVSRGELVEIGGSFRVPDILRASGAKLVEVGTTNRTHARDYERAIGPDTAMLLKVHTSNFRVVGFTAEVAEAELAEIAKKANVPLVADLGSGMVVDLGAPGEPHPKRSLRHADLVTFSGDKLLGGPQAGVIAGRAALVEKLRTHPLARAMRIDKLSLAALASTLRLALEPGTAMRIPVVRMVREPAEQVKARAQAIVAALGSAKSAVEVVASEAAFGGGSVPGQSIASFAVAITPAAGGATALEAKLRANDPPVIARVEDDRVLLDARTIAEDEVAEVAAAIDAANPSRGPGFSR